MNSQVQPSPLLPKPILMRSRPKYFFHDDITEKIGSSRQALLLQEQARAQARQNEMEKALADPFDMYDSTDPHQPEQQQDFDLILSHDDTSIVSSAISLATGEDWEDDVWDLSEYSAVADYRKYSWTIDVYDRERIAGDSVWFRVSYNGQAGYREYEDTEIIKNIQTTIRMNSCFCFYVRVKFGDSDDDEPVSLFESELIVPALKAILRQAECTDEIVIPTKSEVQRKKVPKAQEKRDKHCFLPWLFRFPFSGTDKQPLFIEI